MSVFKEGYHALELIHKSAKQIWPDACDFGTPVKENSVLWNSVKQLCDWHGIKSTRYASAPDKKHRTVSIYVSLMDEWTAPYPTEFFKVTYNKCPGIPDADGYLEFWKVTDATQINELTKAEEAQMT
jgi:hypothetical protein